MRNLINSLMRNFSFFLTSNLITYSVDRFTSGMESISIAYLLSGSEHILIGFWVCTRYGFCGVCELHKCKDDFSMKLCRAGNVFQLGLNKSFDGVAQGLRIADPGPYLIMGSLL